MEIAEIGNVKCCNMRRNRFVYVTFPDFEMDDSEPVACMLFFL